MCRFDGPLCVLWKSRDGGIKYGGDLCEAKVEYTRQDCGDLEFGSIIVGF